MVFLFYNKSRLKYFRQHKKLSGEKKVTDSKCWNWHRSGSAEMMRIRPIPIRIRTLAGSVRNLLKHRQVDFWSFFKSLFLTRRTHLLIKKYKWLKMKRKYIFEQHFCSVRVSKSGSEILQISKYLKSTICVRLLASATKLIQIHEQTGPFD